MKRCASLVAIALVAAFQVSLGQTDTNIVAVGDWSAPRTDNFRGGNWAIQGRLLVYAERAPDTNYVVNLKGDAGTQARVFLELQDVSPAESPPVEVYFDDN